MKYTDPQLWEWVSFFGLDGTAADGGFQELTIYCHWLEEVGYK